MRWSHALSRFGLLIGAAGRIAAPTAACAGEENLKFKFVVKAIELKAFDAPNIEGQTLSAGTYFGVAFSRTAGSRSRISSAPATPSKAWARSKAVAPTCSRTVRRSRRAIPRRRRPPGFTVSTQSCRGPGSMTRRRERAASTPSRRSSRAARRSSTGSSMSRRRDRNGEEGKSRGIPWSGDSGEDGTRVGAAAHRRKGLRRYAVRLKDKRRRRPFSAFRMLG
jgi:hypothetical protein